MREFRCELFPGNPIRSATSRALRFAAPEPYNTTFDGVLRATSPAPNCPQFTTGGELVKGTFSEDWYADLFLRTFIDIR